MFLRLILSPGFTVSCFVYRILKFVLQFSSSCYLFFLATINRTLFPSLCESIMSLEISRGVSGLLSNRVNALRALLSFHKIPLLLN